MRHQCKGRKLGSSYSHTKAMKRGLVRQLFLNDRIKTTETRAKEIRGNVDKIVTWAKKGDLHSRRLAIAALGNDKELVREIFEKVSQGLFEGRSGGYTRIMKLGPRKGDGAPVVIIELVTEPVAAKTAKKATAKATPKKAAPKKVEKADSDSSESVIEEVKESIEAAEENFAAEVQAEGQEQLAEEKAEAEKDEAKVEEKEAEKAEEVREEQFEKEEAKAEDAQAEELKAEAEEKAK